MRVRVLIVLAALVVLHGCGQASSPPERQEERGGVEQAQPEEPKEPTTPPPLEYGDPVELIGVPWSEPQQIDYEGRRVVLVIFQYAEGAGAEGGDRFAAFASGYGGQAAKELRAAGATPGNRSPRSTSCKAPTRVGSRWTTGRSTRRSRWRARSPRGAPKQHGERLYGAG